MRKSLFFIIGATVLLSSCQGKKTDNQSGENPLMTAYTTPYNVPPFENIKPEHYLPAFEKAMADHKAEVAAIISNQETATFENTIVALDNAGQLLSEVSSVYFSLKSAHGVDGIMAISSEVSQKLSAHGDDISLNPELFERVKTVYEQKEALNLTTEQNMLLDKTYKGFVRSGVNLPEDKKVILREINARSSELANQFNKNLLAETNSFKLVIENEKELAGLPESVIAAAAETASEMNMTGKWVFTTQKPSMLPFIQYAENRDLREKLYKGYYMRGNNNDSLDNKGLISEMVQLRVKKANLLGYDSYADYVLEERMAKKPEKVYELLENLWSKALPVAKKERAEMQKIIDREGGNFKLESWDWWYYAEKVRKEKYDLDENHAL